MKAVGIKKSYPIDHKNSFIEFQTDEPKPNDLDLLVRIKSVSVNPVDYKIRQNAAKEKELIEPKILGWDAAGIVERVGNKVTKFQQGNEVFYAGEIDRPGCNAEFQLVNENITAHKPKNVSFEEAAALPLTSLTAWECIFERLKIEENSGENQDILIIGGAGGVGSIAIQLLNKLTKFNVIATASRNETANWCKTMGANVIVNHKNLVEQMKAKGHKEVDYILNFADTDMHWDAMVELIKPQGSICAIVETKKPVDLNKLKNKSAAFHWEFMFTRTKFKTSDMAHQHQILQRISKLLEEGTITTTLHKTFSKLSPETFKEVHSLQESGKSIGKNVISF